MHSKMLIIDNNSLLYFYLSIYRTSNRETINLIINYFMKKVFLSLLTLSCLTASAQFGAPRQNPIVASVTENVTEDFKPAISNQDSKQYPMVNSQRMVRAQISAPDAKFVGLDIAGKIYTMTKDENGVWTGTSEPQDEGFHYYQLNIDGASVPDPGSLYYYGASRWGSGIEVPSADQDFWQVKNVPQGSVRGFLLVNLHREDASLSCISARRVLYQPHQEIPSVLSAARYG